MKNGKVECVEGAEALARFTGAVKQMVRVPKAEADRRDKQWRAGRKRSRRAK